MSDTSGRARSGGEARRAEEGPKTIFVVPHPDTGDRVALWEVNPLHPTGEVFVAGQNSEPCEVAVTPAVESALAPQGDAGNLPPRLVRLEGSALERRKAVSDQAVERREALRQQALLAAGEDADVVKASNANARLVRELSGKLHDLETKLAQARSDSDDALREQAEKDNSPENAEARAKEVEEANKTAVTQAHLDTYDYNEPVQGQVHEGGQGPEGAEVGRRAENVRRRRAEGTRGA